MDIPLLLSIIGIVLGLVQLVQAHRQGVKLARTMRRYRIDADSDDGSVPVSMPNILLGAVAR